MKKIAVQFLFLVLISCTSDERAGEASNHLPATAHNGPFVFREGEMRVHIVQYCEGKTKHRALDVLQSVSVEPLCGSGQLLHLSVENERRERTAPITQWLVLPMTSVSSSTAFLKAQKIIDENGDWIWGDGIVVLAEGVLSTDEVAIDRLWFWQQLDVQAKQNGGAIHVVLGSNELRAMAGDYRFNAVLQATADRWQWHAGELFGMQSEFGRWLRDQSLLVQINDVLFAQHIPDVIVMNQSIDLESINSAARRAMHARWRLATDTALNALIEQYEKGSVSEISAEQLALAQEKSAARIWLTTTEQTTMAKNNSMSDNSVMQNSVETQNHSFDPSQAPLQPVSLNRRALRVEQGQWHWLAMN